MEMGVMVIFARNTDPDSTTLLYPRLWQPVYKTTISLFFNTFLFYPKWSHLGPKNGIFEGVAGCYIIKYSRYLECE